MAAGGGHFCRPRTYQERTILNKIEEREIIERYWLSREVINSLVDEFSGENLSRDTIQYEKLSAVRENSGKYFAILELEQTPNPVGFSR